MRIIFLVFCLSLSGCAMDRVLIRWHDGKEIMIDGGAKSLVKIKFKDGEVEVDNRKTSTMQTLFEMMTLKIVTDNPATAR